MKSKRREREERRSSRRGSFTIARKTGDGGILKRILLAVAVLAVLVPISVAQAEPVQEFSFQLKDVKPDGRFTVVFTSRTYDTTGGVPPVLKQNFIRVPAGAKFSKEFLKKKYYCDGSQAAGLPAPQPRRERQVLQARGEPERRSSSG